MTGHFPSPRVVIADDAADFRALLRIKLDRDGRFQVVGEAANGPEALEVAAQQRPDALILDLAMPLMDGLQALEQLRVLVPDTKVLVLSGFAATDMEAKVRQLGAHAYLEKGEAVRRLGEVLAELCLPPPVSG